MEFWGIEIKPGKPLKVQPDFGYAIHVSQFILDFVFALMLTDEENDSDSDELEEYMEQLPQRNEPMGQKCGFIRSALKRKPEENESDSDEDESDSDEMGSEEDSDDEEVEDKAPLKVESPSKKGPNDEAVKNTVASKKECPNKAFIAAGGKKPCRC